ncbi:aspartyl-tRNA synthetase [Viridothelium virens]|uniref:Probable aspartate--tRNA ligase, cytoplasmic n=1 Tax=Viridothelium virens TaxID=1048519 RepID=A0A6A6GYF8_VIRVR|nr:aspartyl-tRNA synthetase [Viridothelium virens]
MSRAVESEAPSSDAGPSKNALKKAAKDKEKAEKAAKRKAQEDAQKAASAASDVSSHDYGDLPTVGLTPYTPSGVHRITLRELVAQLPPTPSGSGALHAEEASAEPEARVALRCVVENARVQSAKLAFLVLRQGAESVQAVVAASETLSRQMVKFAGGVPAESVVLVEGVVRRPKEAIKSASVGHLELHVERFFVVSRSESQLPLQVEDAERAIPAEGLEGKGEEDDGRPIVTLNTRLEHRVIDLRARHNAGIFKIKDGVCALFSEYLRDKGFVGVQTPKLLGAATEGGSNVFEVTYFGKKAYLAQSPQFYKQMMVAARYEKVMEIGPIFRAENSNTARHLTEFTGLDMEMAFEEDYHEVMTVLEELMLHIFNGLRTRYAKETELVRSIYHVDEFKLPEAGKVPRIQFPEAVKMLRGAGEQIGDFDDLSTPQEKLLGRLILEKYSTDFYVIDQYPLAVRPFYAMPSAQTTSAPLSEQYSNSYDFFMRGQEIMSGGQRVHDAALLSKRMKEFEPPLDPTHPGFKDYVNAFKYGCPPHGGGGIGLERIVMLWLGLPNVRLASLFPRDPVRLAP